LPNSRQKQQREKNSLNEIHPHITVTSVEEEKIWEILQEVNDPEVPVLSILDLGIVRQVAFDEVKSLSSLHPLIPVVRPWMSSAWTSG
jgi:hypothetical protein